MEDFKNVDEKVTAASTEQNLESMIYKSLEIMCDGNLNDTVPIGPRK